MIQCVFLFSRGTFVPRYILYSFFFSFLFTLNYRNIDKTGGRYIHNLLIQNARVRLCAGEVSFRVYATKSVAILSSPRW